MGIRLYFDRALPTLLLYKAERPQFDELARLGAIKPMAGWSDVYGAEHLVRLFGACVRVARMSCSRAPGADALAVPPFSLPPGLDLQQGP